MPIHHMSLDIAGALRNKSFNGYTDDKGRPMSPQDVKEQLQKLLARGDKLMSMAGGECEGFSPLTGCPGHDCEEE